MTDSCNFHGSADLAALETICAQAEDFGRHHGWPEELQAQVRLVLEELIVNVIHYGAANAGDPTQLEVGLSVHQGQLRIEVSDNGIAFDPLSLAEPDVTADLEDRPVGGLGIFLVRELMDTVAYRRDGAWNRFWASKTLTP